MNRFLKLLSLCLFLTLTVPLQAITNGVVNEPDSVYLFSYSHADGSGGLKLAWSPNGNRWFSVAEGSSFVNSDFGPWGQMKRMLKPHLMQTRADDRWHCIWELTESGNSLAYVESPDLLQWKAQKYFDRSRLAEYRPEEVYPNVRKEVLLNGTVQQGWMQRVPYATVQRVISFAEHKKYRQALHAERTEQDPVRFAGLKPVEATIEVETECAKPISKHLIGIFFEDINYAADGGLYAELVQNRDFEYSSKDGSHQGWDGTYAWAVKEGDAAAAVTIAAADPIHPNNPHYAVLEARPGVTLQNDGFDGISLKEVKKAAKAAYEEYYGYFEKVRARGEEILETAEKQGKEVIVLAGRPYHVDPEINHGIDKLIASYGVAIISEDVISSRVKKFHTGVLNQWTYHSRLYAAAHYLKDQPHMNLVQLVSFGCGVDAITTDEVRDILESEGKIYTQIKIDEITNLGAVKIRLRSLFAALDQE